MLQTILVAVDSSPQHAAILDHAAELAILSGANVHVATVADPTWAGVASQICIEVETILNTACMRLSERGVPCQTYALTGVVPEQINLLAAEVQASIIIIGHRQLTWMQRLFENSVGNALLEHAPCNVLIVKEGAV